MAGIMEFLGRPEFAMYLSNLGQGLQNADRGQPMNMGPGNMALMQMVQARQQGEKLKGLMESMEGLTPQQRSVLESVSPDMAMKALIGHQFPQAGDPKRYNVGGALVDAQGNVIYQGEGGGAFEGTSMDAQMYNILLDPNSTPQMRQAAQHYFGQPRYQMTDQGLVAVPGQVPNFGGDGAPTSTAAGGGVQPPATGVIPGTEKSPQLTEGERGASGYYQRMVEAENALTPLYEKGYTSPSIFEQQAIGTGIESYVLSEDDQLALQAQRDWVRAKLRKESGAVIGPEEMEDEIRTYFPQPGDSQKVREQKARARETATKAMREQAGRAIRNGGEDTGAGGGGYTPPDKPIDQWTDEELEAYGRAMGFQ